MKTDSHWTPEGMRLGAVMLAALLEREQLLPVAEGESFRAGTERMTGGGDLATLLGGAGKRWSESVDVHPIERIGKPQDEPTRWTPDPESPVLLLGDSFTNVFSLPEMGWGESGGFAETLSQSLGYSIDRIARNADGAVASRRALRESAGRLDGKKLVVWQFAARELSFGDWRVMELPDERSPDRAELAGEPIILTGTIAAVAPVSPVTRTPYRQAVMEVHLREVRSDHPGVPDEVVLLGMGVEDRKPTAMTRWAAGQELKVTVVPWRAVEERFGRLRRLALEDPELELLEMERFWMTE